MSRDFDPRFSTALRDELTRRADAVDAEPVRVERRAPRAQVWIAVVTAAVLVVATLGVLRLVQTRAQPAHPGRSITSPLMHLTDPHDPDYVARSVRTLLDVKGIGSGSRTFDVPADVTDARIYFACTPSSPFDVAVAGGPGMSSSCDGTPGGAASGAIRPGARTVQVTVHPGVLWALTIIRTPAPTVSTGPLIDPLTQVRDRRDPDALTGDTTPLLRSTGTGAAPATGAAVPAGVGVVRVFLACRPASAVTHAVVDGHRIDGCQNSIAHWFDLAPTGGRLTAAVDAPAGLAWSLLVVRAPAGARPSPANALLPLPARTSATLVEARGAGAQATGVYRGPEDGVDIRTACRGTGWLEVQVGASGTSTTNRRCSSTPDTVGFGGEQPDVVERVRWTVTPHGDISWSAVISRSDESGVTTSSTLAVTQPPLAPPTGPAGSTVLASAGGTTGGASGRFVQPASEVEVDVVCRGTGGVVVRVGGGTLGSSRDGDQQACRTGATVRTFVPTDSGLTVDGAPADWQVVPYGDVEWVVVLRTS